MKIFFYAAAVAGMMVGLAACGGGQSDNVKTADSANEKRADSLSAQRSVTDSGTSVPSKQDAEFMVKATNGAQFEVVLGKVALLHALNPGVRRFGEMMVQDHTKGQETFRGLAAAKRIIMPDTISREQKKERDELQKKRGAAFDRAYIKMMVADHKEDISEFQRAAQKANDPDIRALAAANIPLLQRHLDSAQNLATIVK